MRLNRERRERRSAAGSSKHAAPELLEPPQRRTRASPAARRAATVPLRLRGRLTPLGRPSSRPAAAPHVRGTPRRRVELPHPAQARWTRLTRLTCWARRRSQRARAYDETLMPSPSPESERVQWRGSDAREVVCPLRRVRGSLRTPRRTSRRLAGRRSWSSSMVHPAARPRNSREGRRPAARSRAPVCRRPRTTPAASRQCSDGVTGRPPTTAAE